MTAGDRGFQGGPPWPPPCSSASSLGRFSCWAAADCRERAHRRVREAGAGPLAHDDGLPGSASGYAGRPGPRKVWSVGWSASPRPRLAAPERSDPSRDSRELLEWIAGMIHGVVGVQWGPRRASMVS